MSKGAIIGGIVVMVCLLVIVGVFMMNSNKRTSSMMEPQMAKSKVPEHPVAGPLVAGPPVVEEKISGYVKLYSGCNYDGEVLKSSIINDIPISNIDNFKGNITSDHYTAVPLAQRHKLVFKSIETKNVHLTGTFDNMSSQKGELDMAGSQRMSFCDPNNQGGGGATKLNLTFKLKKY